MTNAEILAAVQILLRQLQPEPAAPVIAIDPTVGNTPAGAPMGVYNGPTVAVTPTGSRASGETRYWPIPLPGENWFGYLMRLSSIKRPDGLPYIAAQYRAQISNVLLGGGPTRQIDFAWQADCFAYPEDWRSEAQWQQQERDLAAWAETHRRMQERFTDAPVAAGGTL